jgi:ATP-dependent Clp protease ATP-binding subunit ClpB
MQQVRRHFRPEFLNRLDEVIMFQPLALEQLRQIVQMNLQLIGKRLAEKDIRLELDESAVSFILQEAYDPLFGARPLRRYMEQQLVTMVSRGILQQLIPNHSVVKITTDRVSKKLSFEVVADAKKEKKLGGYGSAMETDSNSDCITDPDYDDDDMSL